MNVHVYLKWMYMNNQKWRLIYIYIYIYICVCVCVCVCVDISYVHIYGHIFWKCKIYRSNLKLDVEQYIFSFFFFYHNFLQIAVILALYRIFINVRYFDILLLYKKYIASRFQFSFIDFLNNFINSTGIIFPFIFCLFYFSVLIFFW